MTERFPDELLRLALRAAGLYGIQGGAFESAAIAAMRAVLEGQPCECSLALVQSLNAAKEEIKALTGAYWALGTLQEKHETLRVAVMVEVSNPHQDWATARANLTRALNEAFAPGAASDGSPR